MRFTSQTRSIPLIAIGIAAAIFLLVSYQYSQYTLTQIDTAAVDNVHSNAVIQATDTAGALAAKLEGVAESVAVLADSIANDSSANVGTLLASAQSASQGFTSQYFWLNANGTLASLNNGTTVNVTPYAGTNYSQRPFFTGPILSGHIYVTGAVASLSNTSLSHVFVSDAVLLNSTSPKSLLGVVGATVELKALGTFLESQVSPGLNGQIGLIDSNATILYTQNSTLIGQSLYSHVIQDELPAPLGAALDGLVSLSLQGTSGVSDVPLGSGNITIAYTPVFLPGLSFLGNVHEFGVVYVLLSDTLAGNNAALISQLRLLSSFIIVGIAGIAVATAVVFLSWNKRLDDTVRKRTSDLVSANEQLKAYAQSQTDFVNIAAHELRTPTQSILGFTEILQDAAKNESAQSKETESLAGLEISEAVDSISNNARRLKKLTDDILTVSRLDDNRMSLTKERFDLNDAIRDVITDIKTNTAGKEGGPAAVEFEQVEPSIVIVADSTKVHEILSNLLNNAVRFSEGKGTIVVRASKVDGREVMVSVRDEGKGIDPEVLPRLFNKFVTTSPSGTGLGLFIASKLVAAHGGSMWAENNPGPEGGSTFSFTLPTGEPDYDASAFSGG